MALILLVGSSQSNHISTQAILSSSIHSLALYRSLDLIDSRRLFLAQSNERFSQRPCVVLAMKTYQRTKPVIVGGRFGRVYRYHVPLTLFSIVHRSVL